MAFDTRPVLGNSLGGGLWKKPEVEAATMTPAQSIQVDAIPLDKFKSGLYYIVLWNDAADKIKSFMMNVGKKNGQVQESVYNKIGGPINIALSTAEISGNIVVSITNNEAFNVNIDVARLVLGRP